MSTVSPLRQRMIEVMAARQLGRHSQRSHVHSSKRFAAFPEALTWNLIASRKMRPPVGEGTATRALTGCQRPFAFPGTVGVAGPVPRGSAGCPG